MAGSEGDAETEIARRYAAQISQVRSASRSLARRADGANDEADLLPFDQPIEGPAISVPGVHIVATMNYWEMTDLGSFPGGAPVLGVQVLISGHPVEYAVSRDIDVVLPQNETGAWAAAILGSAWLERGYFLRNSAGRWERLHRYLVLVDQDGDPVPAPEDFYFAGVSFGSGAVTVRPLAASNDGPAPTEMVAPTERSPSLLWPVELTGTGPDTVMPAARALLAALRIKGAVHHQFELVALRLSGTTAHIRYRCRDTGKELERPVPLPADTDFREGFEFFRHSVPRLGALPIRASEQWTTQLVDLFKEMFATGTMGRPVAQPS
ncbi:hypothetical protein ACWF82_01975 [Nocardia sp. NPDC055053]